MAAIKALQVISVPVSDPDRAKSFYVDVLGFELVTDNVFDPEKGLRWIQLKPGAGETSIALNYWSDDVQPGSLRGNFLEVEDLPAAKEELTGRGLSFTGESMNTPWGVFTPFVDPDGNRWDLSSPPVQAAP